MTTQPAPLTPLNMMGADAEGMCGPDGCLLPASHPAMTDAPVETAPGADTAQPAAD